MASNLAKRQKRLERKRKKRKVKNRALRTVSAGPTSLVSRMRRAANWPLRECLINEVWETSGLATVIVSRDRPGGGVATSTFLVDVGCLGVKNAFSEDNYSLADYERMLHSHEDVGGELLSCEPSFAVKLIHGAIGYAATLGFRPHRDFAYAKEILGDIDPATCAEEIVFGGQDGKPFYVEGPHDNPDRIIATLNRHVGPDGFHYVL